MSTIVRYMAQLITATNQWFCALFGDGDPVFSSIYIKIYWL